MNFRPTLLALLFAASAAQLEAQRLPTNVHPEHYKLEIAPYLDKAVFEGLETIDVTLDQPSATVTLNCLEIDVRKVTAGGQTGTVSYNPALEQATFTFPQPLPAGKSSIQVVYSGILNDKLRGFYLSKTKARNYAVTQFESTDARRAFPSFDEPAMKATFDVSLTIDAADTAISNGPIIADSPAGPGKHTLTFGTTPKMSTYLVAFLVGDFACEKGKSDGIPIRVCTTPDKVKLTKFAVKSAEFTLHYYDQYFGIKYPMAKLDLIGIPDFEAGAMENFGAITYRETDLLVDEKTGAVNSKKEVSSVIAHEMAHQWFGDMVTMQWWDNLWLNEGFATWMQDKAAAAWHPEWKFPQDVASSVQGTLNLDAIKTTHPILAKDTQTPAQIAELFDGITYGKGGAVLGMVENFLGPEVFRQGVHNYLQAHMFGNATAEDFWTAQTANSHQPVDKIMQSFIVQPGVPLLTFGDVQASGYPVTQSRFYLAPESVADKSTGGWTVPVCVKSATGPVCKILTPADSSLSLLGSSAPTYLFANAAGKGYYRVSYSPAQLQAIIAGVNTLTPPEKLDLLGDRWALTRAGQAKVGEYLDLALALKQDADASVVQNALSYIATINARIANADDTAQLNEKMRKELGPVYASLGKPSKKDAYDKDEIRNALFAVLGRAKDPAVLAEASKLTDDLFSGDPARMKSAKESPLADTAIYVAAAQGDEALYNKLQTVSQKATDDPGLQTQALFTLADFQNPLLVVRTLDYAVSGQVRNQDSWILIARELQQPETREVAWQYVQQHWEKVSAQFTTASGARIVTAVGSFCTVAQRKEVADFFATHKVEAAERTLTQSIDSIDACIQLRAKQEPNLRQWLSTHQ
ncbi:aminopeptidase N/puromycin-sensitive aminopeptidase [Granulicella rosea]|uniref:Aminopeptidase n=1 Tax=Granulicella rosea TaxID=474952 RepID=A0A239KU93_9BACT|nr:M1 family metallopeptidase [Granulicella rosea]SNT20804.1 aminopeptidase N/puromycin-sensitive aminopeptidase [Granulicella rosea]